MLKSASDRGDMLVVGTAAQNQIDVYTSARAADALEELTSDMTLYKGVRLLQIMEAVYRQGKIDGARAVFDRVEEVKNAIPHRRPGRPRTKRR